MQGAYHIKAALLSRRSRRRKIQFGDDGEMGLEMRWGFSRDWSGGSGEPDITVRGVLYKIMGNLNKDDGRKLIPLGHGDPSQFSSFRTTPVAQAAVNNAINSGEFNSYVRHLPGALPTASCAVADYLSGDLPYQLSQDDVYITMGCTQAIEVSLGALAKPGANVLLPRPGFPGYESRCAFEGIEMRHFDLLPEQNWEVDLNAVEAMADENTVAMVIINPGNPSGSVFTYQHLQKVAETAKKLGILVMADEVYHHLAFGDTPFVAMGVFGSIVPVLTLGSISKRWVVPGWRLGWLAINDTNGILKQTGVTDSIERHLKATSEPPTFMQGALPDILEKTSDAFFSKILQVLKEDAEICYKKVIEIPCIVCPRKPEGSMFVMVKLDSSKLEDIVDDMDFCLKLAREESVLVLPGIALLG